MGRRSDPGDGRTRLHVTLLYLLMISSLIRVAGLETLNERWFEPARLIVCRKATTFFFNVSLALLLELIEESVEVVSLVLLVWLAYRGCVSWRREASGVDGIVVHRRLPPSTSPLSVVRSRRPSLLSARSALSIMFAHRRLHDSAPEFMFHVMFHAAVCLEAVSRYVCPL